MNICKADILVVEGQNSDKITWNTNICRYTVYILALHPVAMAAASKQVVIFSLKILNSGMVGTRIW
jgi:hypothetical protein